MDEKRRVRGSTGEKSEVRERLREPRQRLDPEMTFNAVMLGEWFGVLD